MITLLYEKTLKVSMIDKKIDEKQAVEIKKIYNHYIDKRKTFMKNALFKIEDTFGDAIRRNNFSREPITKLNKFSAKIM